MDTPKSIADYRLYPAIQSQPVEASRLLQSDQDWSGAAARLDGAARVWCVGIGTSFNAARAASWMLRAAGHDARPVTSMEFASWPNLRGGDAAVVFAHSGRKQLTGASLDHLIDAATPTVLITGIDSQIDGDALPDTVTALRTTHSDPSAMFTVSHIGAMTVAARLAHTASPGCLGDLNRIPAALNNALALEPQIAQLAQDWSDGALIALGRRPAARRGRRSPDQDRRSLPTRYPLRRTGILPPRPPSPDPRRSARDRFRG